MGANRLGARSGFAATFMLAAVLTLALAACVACKRRPQPTQPYAPASPSSQPVVVGFRFTYQGMAVGPHYSIRRVGDAFLCATTSSKVYWLELDGEEQLEELTVSRDGTYAYDKYAGVDPLGKGAVYSQVALSQADMEDFTKLLADHGVLEWDGFDEYWEPPAGFEVTDTGSTFDLQVLLSDGTRVNAHGMDAYPEGYGDAVLAIMDFFEAHGCSTW